MGNNARRRAWETRRKKYGQQGHKGSYSRFQNCSCTEIAKTATEAEVLKLLQDGVLSEGQAASILGIDRIELRIKADALESTQQEGGEL